MATEHTAFAVLDFNAQYIVMLCQSVGDSRLSGLAMSAPVGAKLKQNHTRVCLHVL